jgi:hypothetical protein
MNRRPGLGLAGVVLVLAGLGGLLVGPVPLAHACVPGGSVVDRRISWLTERVPVSQATEADRRWASPILSGPDYLEVIQPRSFPPGGVMFEGTVTEVGASPPDATGWSRTMWTHFRVEQVLRGDLPPEVVIVNPGLPCTRGHVTYELGVRQQVVAAPHPVTGELHGLGGRYEDPPPIPGPTAPPPPGPAERLLAVALGWLRRVVGR